MDLNAILEKSRKSRFYLWLLNTALHRKIPFNKPHSITIERVNEEDILIKLPYKKSNLNHIKGLHACGIATLAEYATGLNLLRRLPIDKYRIIMQKIEINYLYQGKESAYASYEISEDWLNKNIYDPLKTSDKTVVDCIIDIRDESENKLAEANITWQIKDWEKVRTKK